MQNIRNINGLVSRSNYLQLPLCRPKYISTLLTGKKVNIRTYACIFLYVIVYCDLMHT